MKTVLSTLLALSWLGLACTARPAHASDNRAYKSGEYAVVAHGRAPDRQWSIAAHGDGDMGLDNFHLYLMAEPGHRKIGPLEEIRDVLDTTPEAYEAKWSADSRHVAVLYRTDNHIVALVLYRIQNRRAYPVTGPTLLRAVAAARSGAKSSVLPAPRSRYLELTWLSPTRFALQEQVSFESRTPALARALGKFARSERQEPQEGDSGASYWVDFSAEGVCELVNGDRYRVVSLKPGSFGR